MCKQKQHKKLTTDRTLQCASSASELSDVPEEIINVLHSFDCDSNEDFVGFE
jgi:hypothetical protein